MSVKAPVDAAGSSQIFPVSPSPEPLHPSTVSLGVSRYFRAIYLNSLVETERCLISRSSQYPSVIFRLRSDPVSESNASRRGALNCRRLF